MNRKLPLLERAFELAKSGEVQTISEIKARLSAEGYSDIHQQISGAALTGQLKRLCKEARV